MDIKEGTHLVIAEWDGDAPRTWYSKLNAFKKQGTIIVRDDAVICNNEGIAKQVADLATARGAKNVYGMLLSDFPKSSPDDKSIVIWSGNRVVIDIDGPLIGRIPIVEAAYFAKSLEDKKIRGVTKVTATTTAYGELPRIEVLCGFYTETIKNVVKKALEINSSARLSSVALAKIEIESYRDNKDFLPEDPKETLARVEQDALRDISVSDNVSSVVDILSKAEAEIAPIATMAVYKTTALRDLKVAAIERIMGLHDLSKIDDGNAPDEAAQLRALEEIKQSAFYEITNTAEAYEKSHRDVKYIAQIAHVIADAEMAISHLTLVNETVRLVNLREIKKLASDKLAGI